MQVLCAHIFGVTLLHESETVFGLVGSAAIAAGVLTVNSAKIAKAEAAPLRVESTGRGLPQYSLVSAHSDPTDSSKAITDAKAMPGRGSWGDWSAAATKQLADMQLRYSLKGTEAGSEGRASQVPALTDRQTEHSAVKQAEGGESAREQLDHVDGLHMISLGSPESAQVGHTGGLPGVSQSSQQYGRVEYAGTPASRQGGRASSSDSGQMSHAVSVSGFSPGSWTAASQSMQSPRLNTIRSSTEMQDFGKAAEVTQETSLQGSEVSESQPMAARELGSRKAASIRTDRNSTDRPRGQNLRDRELSFGDWHFQRPGMNS